MLKVKIFDEGHEKDLENDINDFIDEEIEIIDIKYSVSCSVFSEEQIYCYSALIMYKNK
ncbi:MAG: sporulation protein Cse60 [Bacilli bacterium]